MTGILLQHAQVPDLNRIDTYERVGGSESLTNHARIVTATNKPVRPDEEGRALRHPVSSDADIEVKVMRPQDMPRAVAPVKDPFSWPKTSLSISVGGSAARFTATNGSALRGA